MLDGEYDSGCIINLKVTSKKYSTYFNSPEEALAALARSVEDEDVYVEAKDKIYILNVVSQVEIERQVKVVPVTKEVATVKVKGVKK